MRWLMFACALALGCGDGNPQSVDLAGKSVEEITMHIVEVSCDTKCPQLGVYCLAPDMSGAGGGCRAEVTVEDRGRCKQIGLQELGANLACTPLSEAEVQEANQCLNELLARECPYSMDELEELAAGYDGQDMPMLDEATWPDTCNRVGELLWNPAPPVCDEPPSGRDPVLGEDCDLVREHALEEASLIAEGFAGSCASDQDCIVPETLPSCVPVCGFVVATGHEDALPEAVADFDDTYCDRGCHFGSGLCAPGQPSCDDGMCIWVAQAPGS